MTIELTSVTYAYRRLAPPVFTDLTYRIPERLTVLLGPNGAGKSTLLKLAATVLRPDAGTVTLDGAQADPRDHRKAVAWMPQRITAMTAHTAREQVAYVGWLKGMNRRTAWDRAAHALERVQLTAQADTRTARLSGGQLRRVGLASALVHDARVLLLDEPTAGLDPRQRRVFRDLLNGLADEVRVLLSTHDVVDLADEADHVTVLDAGRLTYDGTTAGFLAHAPEGAAPGRTAEAAYAALSESEALL